MLTPNLVPRASSSSMYPDRCLRGSKYRYLCHTSRPPSLLGSDVLSPSLGRFLFHLSLLSLSSLLNLCYSPPPTSSSAANCFAAHIRLVHINFCRGEILRSVSSSSSPITPGINRLPSAANLRLFGRGYTFPSKTNTEYRLHIQTPFTIVPPEAQLARPGRCLPR